MPKKSGNPDRWQSIRWSDGSRYEGLVHDDACHVRGVFTYAAGDRYMGEYVENHMDGYGVYVWPDGTLYRGQWRESRMEGCGVKMTKQPSGRLIAEEGQFEDDAWVGPSGVCTVEKAHKAAAQADTAAQMARVFEVTPQPSAATKSRATALQSPQGGAARDGSPLQQLQGHLQSLLPKLPKLGGR